MNILDHLILTLENYFSFADEGGIIEKYLFFFSNNFRKQKKLIRISTIVQLN